jgi:alpha-amylase
MSTRRAFLAVPLSLVLLTCASHRPVDRVAPSAPLRRTASQWNHDWANGAVFYEVFVRSFSDSDGDGKGDLEGLISKLDYLNDGNTATTDDLGVDALWLMPVFKSPSYHGYDTTDYETINPDYGTNADFARLCDEAHRRGIRVIVDFVANHTGSDHPWFVESASSPASRRRDWYVWRGDDPGWTPPWGGSAPTWHPLNGAFFYGVFWSGMPDLNFRSAAVRQEIERLVALWLERGVDGFRLDAARHLVENGPGSLQVDQPETHAVWREFAESVRRVKPEAVLVGENWTDTPIIATYYGSTKSVPGGDELPLNFDFPLSDRIVQGLNAGNASGIADKLAEIQRVYPAGATDAPFLTNHDQVRLATQLGRSAGKMRNAAAILLTLPGAPFLYYGEEVGLENGTTSNDEAKRTPMPWDATEGGGFTTGTPWFPFAPGKDVANVAAQTNDPASLLSRYRSLIRARHGSGALTRGDLETVFSGSSQILAFTRTDGSEHVLAAHNLSDQFATGGPYDLPGSTAGNVFVDPGAGASGSPGSWRVTLPPRASGVWRVR